MKKSTLRRAAAAGLALMMVIALAPGMGLASQAFYTVTYDPNAPGNQAPRTDSATVGSLYNVRQNPFTNPGFTFSGWNTQANGSGDNYQPGQAITVNSNQTLYVQWKSAPTPNTVTITYKANLGDSQADVIDTVNKGSSYTLRSNPFANPRTYTFIGWNTQANGSGTSYQPGQVLTANGSHTLYAQWKITELQTVTITYKANLGDNQADVIDTVNKGSSYTLRSNPFANPRTYTFIGWNTQANGSGTSYQPGQAVTANGSYTLYAQWKIAELQTVTITYKANLGDNQADVKDTVNKGSAYKLRANPFSYPRNHTFIGWNTQANGSGASYQPGQAITANGNNTLYAQWKIEDSQTVTITYKGSSNDSALAVVDTVNKGSLYTIRNNPFMIIAIYTFVGWNTQADGYGTAYYPGQVITANANLTLYMQVKTVGSQTVTITYKANLGDSQADVKDTAFIGSAYTLRSNPFISRPYDILAGWNTQADGSGIMYYPGQVITTNINFTLYAQWKPVDYPKVTITYKASANGSTTDIIDTVPRGSLYTIRDNPFMIIAIYTFVGWNTQANGSGIMYYPRQVINVNDNLILYITLRLV